MNHPLLPQLLALEEGYEEARKSGMALTDDLRCAIIFKCISGQLKTHLNLHLCESAKYAELREQILKWDRAQAKWFQWLGAAESPDVQPMEIDRIEGKGRGGKAKGKSKDKNKGKNHANSYDHAGKGKGKSGQSQGKGKGGKAEKVCYVCNKPGHYAKDCWHNVRQFAGSSGQSDWTHVTRVSNQQPQTQSEPPSQASQYHSLRKPPSFVLHVSPSNIQLCQLCLICEIARNLHPNQMMVQFEWFTISAC